jgi:transcriptional regulator with XRE-family HTH domain
MRVVDILDRNLLNIIDYLDDNIILSMINSQLFQAYRQRKHTFSSCISMTDLHKIANIYPNIKNISIDEKTQVQQLCHFSKLESLDISSIDTVELSHIPVQIKKLEIYNDYCILPYLPKLEELIISNNEISELEHDSIRRLPKLRSLTYIRGGLSIDLNGFSPYLEKLSIRCCNINIESLIDYNLIELYINCQNLPDNNQLDYLGKLVNLEDLLISVPVENVNFLDKLTNLTSLYIDSTVLETIELNSCFVHLKKMYMYCKQLEELTIQAPNLEYCDITDHNLDDIPSFPSLLHLSYKCDREYNTSISEFPKMDQLTNLEIITDTILTSEINFPKLAKLSLRLTNDPIPNFEYSVNLIKIELLGDIKTLEPLKYLKQLQKIRLLDLNDINADQLCHIPLVKKFSWVTFDGCGTLGYKRCWGNIPEMKRLIPHLTKFVIDIPHGEYIYNQNSHKPLPELQDILETLSLGKSLKKLVLSNHPADVTTYVTYPLIDHDGMIKYLDNLTQLEHLEIHNADYLTMNSLKTIKKLTNLQSLDIWGTGDVNIKLNSRWRIIEYLAEQPLN